MWDWGEGLPLAVASIHHSPSLPYTQAAELQATGYALALSLAEAEADAKAIQREARREVEARLEECRRVVAEERRKAAEALACAEGWRVRVEGCELEGERGKRMQHAAEWAQARLKAEVGELRQQLALREGRVKGFEGGWLSDSEGGEVGLRVARRIGRAEVGEAEATGREQALREEVSRGRAYTRVNSTFPTLSRTVGEGEHSFHTRHTFTLTNLLNLNLTRASPTPSLSPYSYPDSLTRVTLTLTLLVYF